MTSGRAYKKSLLPEKALQELLKYSGLHFDPALVENFRRIIAGEGINPNLRASRSFTAPAWQNSHILLIFHSLRQLPRKLSFDRVLSGTVYYHW